jgi:hypothetical protein
LERGRREHLATIILREHLARVPDADRGRSSAAAAAGPVAA